MQYKYLAAIDIGTNSFHMIIVKLLEDGAFRIIDREREVIRLGSLTGNNLSQINEDEILRAIKILNKFKKVAAFYGATIKAAATSAVREANNKKEFVERVFSETGIKIEIISGNDEARLIYLGISKALPVGNKKFLCIDIGGGSTEFILADKGNIIYAESVKVGAVRLSKKYFDNYILTEKSVKECSDFVEQQILSNKNIRLEETFDMAIGSSGTIESVAAMVSSIKKNTQVKSFNNFSYSKKDLYRTVENILEKKTSQERLTIKGLEAKRADIIPAGVIILKKIFELFRIEEIIISEFALREGIIFDFIYKNDLPAADFFS